MAYYSKEIEHSKNYLVNIAILNNLEFSQEIDFSLNYLATSFDLNYSGGSEFVNQKGRQIASTFKTQPNVSASFTCYMREPDFAIIISRLITGQQEIVVTVGRLENINAKEPFGGLFISLIDESATIFEIIGYISDARISGSVGEFVKVEFTIKADDINELEPNEIIPFDP